MNRIPCILNHNSNKIPKPMLQFDKCSMIKCSHLPPFEKEQNSYTKRNTKRLNAFPPLTPWHQLHLMP